MTSNAEQELQLLEYFEPKKLQDFTVVGEVAGRVLAQHKGSPHFEAMVMEFLIEFLSSKEGVPLEFFKRVHNAISDVKNKRIKEAAKGKKKKDKSMYVRVDGGDDMVDDYAEDGCKGSRPVADTESEASGSGSDSDVESPTADGEAVQTSEELKYMAAMKAQKRKEEEEEKHKAAVEAAAKAAADAAFFAQLEVKRKQKVGTAQRDAADAPARFKPGGGKPTGGVKGGKGKKGGKMQVVDTIEEGEAQAELSKLVFRCDDDACDRAQVAAVFGVPTGAIMTVPLRKKIVPCDSDSDEEGNEVKGDGIQLENYRYTGYFILRPTFSEDSIAFLEAVKQQPIIDALHKIGVHEHVKTAEITYMYESSKVTELDVPAVARALDVKEAALKVTHVEGSEPHQFLLEPAAATASRLSFLDRLRAMKAVLGFKEAGIKKYDKRRVQERQQKIEALRKKQNEGN